MEIAPGVDTSEWRELELDDPHSSDWEKAISIFRSRIHDRFIDPVNFLLDAEASKPATNRRFGFTILAIDCLLVETLGAFLEGLVTTEGKSKATFCKYLTTRSLFRSDFTQDMAEQFYKNFRCGILHQAEIGGGSKVWSVGDLAWELNGELIVNRTEFHGRLKADFENYLLELKNPVNIVLRKNFRKKMDFICRH